MRLWPLSLTLLCACGLLGQEGSGNVKSSKHAPWSMRSAKAYLWLVSPDNDGASGTGLLLISSGDLDCGDFEDFLDWEVDDFASEGNGLLFVLSYWGARDSDDPPPAWNGTYLDTQAVDVNAASGRSMYYTGWSEGTLYDLASSGWVQVDDGVEENLSGEFDVGWWWGSFTADHCGEWKEPGGDDTAD